MLLRHYICIVLFGISISFAERDVGPITKHLRLSPQPDLGQGETRQQGQKQTLQRVHDGYDFKGDIADQPNKFNKPQSVSNESDKPLRRNKRYPRRSADAGGQPKRVRAGVKGAGKAKKKKKAAPSGGAGFQMNIIIGVCLGVIGLGIGAYALFKYNSRGKDGDKKGNEKEKDKGKKKKGKSKKGKKKGKNDEEDEDEDEDEEKEDEDEGEGENEDADEEK